MIKEIYKKTKTDWVKVEAFISENAETESSRPRPIPPRPGRPAWGLLAPKTGFTVTIADDGQTETGNKEIGTLELTTNKYEIIQVPTNTASVHTHIIGMRLAAHNPSIYIKYTMNNTDCNLFNNGSGEPSKTVTLVGDVLVSFFTSKQNCLLASTPILMADNTYKNLGDITTADTVLAYNWKTNILEPRKVIYASKEDVNTNYTTIEYEQRTFSDGTIIKNAFSHRFYNVDKKAFVHLGLWEIGDRLLKRDGTTPALRTVEVIHEPCTFARITLEGIGTNYYAVDALSGDSECPSNLDLDKLQFPN